MMPSQDPPSFTTREHDPEPGRIVVWPRCVNPRGVTLLRIQRNDLLSLVGVFERRQGEGDSLVNRAKARTASVHFKSRKPTD